MTRRCPLPSLRPLLRQSTRRPRRGHPTALQRWRRCALAPAPACVPARVVWARADLFARAALRVSGRSTARATAHRARHHRGGGRVLRLDATHDGNAAGQACLPACRRAVCAADREGADALWLRLAACQASAAARSPPKGSLQTQQPHGAATRRGRRPNNAAENLSLPGGARRPPLPPRETPF